MTAHLLVKYYAWDTRIHTKDCDTIHIAFSWLKQTRLVILEATRGRVTIVGGWITE